MTTQQIELQKLWTLQAQESAAHDQSSAASQSRKLSEKQIEFINLQTRVLLKLEKYLDMKLEESK
jgi:hypothetical protein